FEYFLNYRRSSFVSQVKNRDRFSNFFSADKVEYYSRFAWSYYDCFSNCFRLHLSFLFLYRLYLIFLFFYLLFYHISIFSFYCILQAYVSYFLLYLIPL